MFVPAIDIATIVVIAVRVSIALAANLTGSMGICEIRIDIEDIDRYIAFLDRVFEIMTRHMPSIAIRTFVRAL